MSEMEDMIEMIEKFICPGCVSGSDTKCGKYECHVGDGTSCRNHVLGTFKLPLGNFALGMPKGFNKPGWSLMSDRPNSKMIIRCFNFGSHFEYNRFNIATWALVIDGYMFVRMYSPRINHSEVHIIKDGTLDMVPGAIDVSEFHKEID